MNKIKIWIAPLIASILPVLATYSHNIDQMDINRLFIPIFYSWIFVAVSGFLIDYFVKNNNKTQIINTIWTFFFFSYGYIYLELAKLNFLRFIPLSLNLIMIFGFIFILGLLFLVFKKTNTKNILEFSSLFNFVAISLLVLNLYQIVPAEIKKIIWSKNIDNYLEKNSVFANKKIAEDKIKPDIYYIIFDRYGRQDVLEKYFDFDNQEILDYLEENGFYNIENSYANYPNTFLSLSSSLNSSYLGDLKKEMNDSGNRTVIYEKLIKNNELVEFLKNNGYQYYLLGDFWDASKTSKLANQNFNLFKDFDEFQINIYEKSFANALRGIVENKQLFLGVERLEKVGLNLNFRLNAIERNINNNSPKFVFAHFLLPHEPVVYSADCTYMEFDQIRALDNNAGYLQQLQCANKVIKGLTEKIKNQTNKPVVIIFQSDEGPYLPAEYFNKNGDLVPEEKEPIQIHSSILNSIFISDKENFDQSVNYEKIGFDQNTSPVNTFRIIGNYFFDINLDLLDNKTYIFTSTQHLYDFKNVQDFLNMK